MVYSTCTFNPIEDEAVVAEVLARTKGAMVLVDVSAQLPELKRLPGMRSWKVRDKLRWVPCLVPGVGTARHKGINNFNLNSESPAACSQARHQQQAPKCLAPSL